MYEIYLLPQGKIIINISNSSLSTGVLSLSPKQALPRHNRSVTEQLIQLYGMSTIKLYDKEIFEEVILHENEILVIPANQYHVHTNPTDNISITLWKFEGDITDIIQKIRQENKKIL